MANPVSKTEAQPRSEPGNAGLARVMLIALYGVALVAGYILGTSGVLPQAADVEHRALSELGRVGFALQSETLSGGPADWQQLQQDVAAVGATWEPQRRTILELVVAVRGLNNEQEPNWERAEQLCRALNWPRCDRPALEELRQRSRP